MRRMLIAFALLAIGALPRAGRAASISGAAGFDLSNGPAGATSRDGVGLVDADAGAFDVLAGALRYDDSVLGVGNGLLAGAGAVIAPDTRLRATVLRYLGDGGFRGWRTRLGPQWNRGDASMALTWQHDDNPVVTRSDAALLEAGIPVAGPVAARAEAGYLVYADGTHGGQGALGLAFRLGGHLQLTGMAGMAQRASAQGGGVSPGGGGGGHGLPILGAPSLLRGSDSTGGTDTWNGTTSIALRLLLP